MWWVIDFPISHLLLKLLNSSFFVIALDSIENTAELRDVDFFVVHGIFGSIWWGGVIFCINCGISLLKSRKLK
jgi:hypothetical protein